MTAVTAPNDQSDREAFAAAAGPPVGRRKPDQPAGEIEDASTDHVARDVTVGREGARRGAWPELAGR